MTLRKISGLLCRGPVGRVPLAVPGWAGTPDSSDQHLWPLSIPSNDSEEKLGLAHTRLLLKGARRVFLWELDFAGVAVGKSCPSFHERTPKKWSAPWLGRLKYHLGDALVCYRE
jgi:hypothetical protein